MRISVVIPCYNAERWIRTALESTSAQTHPPQEVIVVDDGSTDGSVEQVEASAVACRVIRSPRAGAAAARNRGIAAASGDWIAFLDADDFWQPHHLERAVRLLTSSSDVGFISNPDVLREESGERSPTLRWPMSRPTSGLSDKCFLKHWTASYGAVTSSMVISKARLEAVGGFDAARKRAEDLDLWLRVIAGQTWSYDPVPATVYRSDSPGSLSKDRVLTKVETLEVLLNNKPRLSGPEMKALIRARKLTLIRIAISERRTGDLAPFRKLLFSDTSLADRVLFSTLLVVPRLSRTWSS